MEKNIKSSWQQWLIAFTLVILIPATVWLGLKAISPNIDSKTYYAAEAAFFKGYKAYGAEEERAQWKERNTDWKKTETFTIHEHKVCVNQFIRLMTYSTFAIILFFLGAIFAMPVVAASFVFSGLILHILSSSSCPIVFGLNLRIIEILFALIGLLIVLWAARRDSRD
ncbi:MAG: hypothetical protein WC747_02805 [Candidatus Babeliales bacterium]